MRVASARPGTFSFLIAMLAGTVGCQEQAPAERRDALAEFAVPKCRACQGSSGRGARDAGAAHGSKGRCKVSA
jgi:hypothetical protein